MQENGKKDKRTTNIIHLIYNNKINELAGGYCGLRELSWIVHMTRPLKISRY